MASYLTPLPVIIPAIRTVPATWIKNGEGITASGHKRNGMHGETGATGGNITITPTVQDVVGPEIDEKWHTNAWANPLPRKSYLLRSHKWGGQCGS